MDVTQQEALSRAVDRWNAGDLDGYLELYDDRIRLHGYAPEPMDKAQVRAFYEGIFAAFPGSRLELHEVLADGDALAARYTLSARHEGEFMGVPATGRDVVVPGITVMHFEGDEVVERHSSMDTLGLLVQLGAVPAPA
jgi:steroid delta-isomerase-like uncharacterized protein